MQLRYVGPIAVSFGPPVGTVEPGEVFEVADDQAESYQQHAHVRSVKKSPGRAERTQDVNP